MIFCVFLASGHSKRFGGNKLLYKIDGVPMAERAFRALPAGMRGVVVTRSNPVAAMARGHQNLSILMNPDKTDNIAETIRQGMRAVPADADGVMFLVCDQPYLTRRSVLRLALSFERMPGRICVLSHDGRSGNPCVFPRSMFEELKNLPVDQPGKFVVHRHPELVTPVQACCPEELGDIDTKNSPL